MHTRINKRPAQVLSVIIVLALLVFPFFPTSINVFAENRPITIFGPMTIERSTGKPLTVSYRVVLPSSIVGPFTVQVQNGPDGAQRVSSGRVILNGKEVLSPNDFNQNVQNIEKQVNLQPENIITVETSIKSKPQSRIQLTIVGINTAPEREVLAEERGTIGPGGGIVALPDVGEIELFEDQDRPDVDIAVRKVRIPSAQELFAEDVSNDPTITYTNTIFELETDTQPTQNSAIRVIVPPEFAAKLLSNQDIDLYMLLDDGEGLSFVSLNSTYDPATGIIVATLPPSAWRLQKEDVTAAYSLISSAHAATTKYVAWIQLASATKSSSGSIASGRYKSISGNKADVAVATNARMNISVEAEVIGRGTLQAQFGSSALTQPFSSSHAAIDYGLGTTETNILATHDGKVQFKYQTSTYDCSYGNKGTTQDGTPLTGYGYYATVTKYDSSGKPLYSTRYAHLKVASNFVTDGGTIWSGDPIAVGDHTGCSSGPHLHFEYRRGTLVSEDPQLYYSDGAYDVSQFQVGLEFNGKLVLDSLRSMEAGKLNYDLPLDLTKERVTSGKRYPLNLVIIEPGGKVTTVDTAFLVVGASPLKVTLRWDKYNTDVDTHVYDSQGNQSWYGNLCGIPNGCLDRDDIDGFGPEVFTLTNAPRGVSYSVKIHYYSDHGNGPTTATVVVEKNGIIVTTRTVSLVSYQWVDIGQYIPNP